MRVEPKAQHILSMLLTSVWLVTLLPCLWAPPQPMLISVTSSNVFIGHCKLSTTRSGFKYKIQCERHVGGLQPFRAAGWTTSRSLAVRN